MISRMRILGFMLCMAALLAPGVHAAADTAEGDLPLAVMLTWQQDPTTTMVIDWQTEGPGDPALHYRPAGASEWQHATGDSRPFPFTERMVHRVELTGLEPASAYEFRVEESGRILRFRTMPSDLSGPVRFAVGGDTRHRQDWMEEVNTVAMQYDPDFIVWGGDLAYADGRADRAYRWFEWFDAVRNTLIAEDGRVVPLVVVAGNHEVRGGYYHRTEEEYDGSDAWRESIAPYFYTFFPFPGHPGYGALDFGDYLSIVLLDTDHTAPIEGAQTEWLAEALAARTHVDHVIPVYHVPAWPSNRSFDGRTQTRVRENWVPLFDAHDNIKVAFENHDHTYKRTHPIRHGEIDPRGVVYIGDGAWGVGERDTHDPDETWYLKRAESRRHAIIVTLQGRHQHFLMVGRDGEWLDEYPETLRVPE